MNKRRTLVLGAVLGGMGLIAAGYRMQPQQSSGGGVESRLQGMQWRFVGPFTGGRTLAVSGVVGDAKTFYLGSVDGGVWKTVDAGASWQPLFDTQPVQSIGALEVAPSDPNVIYVGTGEGCIRNDISYGDGVYKSSDAGKTWTHISAMQDTQHIPRLRIDPKNPNRVFVAALGHASGPNTERGVFRTLDGGATWKKVLYKDDKTGAVDISLDPADSNIVYASLYQQIRLPWGASSGGPGSGLYKSTDGGDTWKQLTGGGASGLPDGVLGKINVAVGADSKTVYAQIEAKEGGLYVSKDAGASWTRVNDSDAYRQRAWYFNHVFADPKDPNTVYELNTGVFRSTDGGKTFRSIHGSDSHGLWIDPTDTDRMITSNDTGASITTNGGQQWTSQNNQPTAEFYHVDADDQPYWELYGEKQDAGSVAIPSHTDHGGIYASDAHSVSGGESGWAVPSPDGQYVYAGNYMALSRWSKSGTENASINPWPEDSMGWGAATLEHRFQWTAPIALSPFDSNTVYYGGEILYKSTDRGSHWTKISKDLTRNDKSKQQSSGGPITQDNTSAEYYDVIFCIAESPRQKGLIWIGTDDGLVQLTRDGGTTWTDVTPPELKQYPQKEWAKVGIVAPSALEAGTAYVAARRNKMDDFAPYAYKTNDYGKTWTKIVSGIPMGSYVNSIKPDPEKKGLLFAGTELGVYASTNDGVSWEPLQFNLPHVSVRDLVIHKDSLAIATHGRGFWIMDDISPLRDWSSQSAAVTLFKPPSVYRERGGGRGGGGGGRGGAAAPAVTPTGLSTPNPPAGPLFVDYVLAQKPNGPVTIALLDAAGKEIHTWSSADNPAPKLPGTEAAAEATPTPAAAAAAAAGRGGRGAAGGRGGRGGAGGAAAEPPAEVPTAAGFNRFAAALPNEPASTDPAHCVPGEVFWGGGGGGGRGGGALRVGMYTVKLTVDGQSYSQPLHITMDPKLHVSDADMTEQYNLAAKVSAAENDLHDAVNDMLSLQKQTAELGSNPALTAPGKQLSDKMQAVIELMANLHSKASEDPLNYAIGIDNKLGDLAGAISGGEGKPTDGMIEVYNDLYPQYTAAMAKWKAIQTTDLPAYNAKVVAAGSKAIVAGPRPTACGGRGGGGGMEEETENQRR